MQLLDYNIMGKTVPFNRIEKQYLKKYMYDRIDTSGWLVTRVYAVAKGKDVPLGTVNFLVSKEMVFREITDNYRKALLIIQVLAAVSFVLSLLIALVVYVRYRNFYRVREIDGGGASGGNPRARPGIPGKSRSRCPSTRTGEACWPAETTAKCRGGRRTRTGRSPSAPRW